MTKFKGVIALVMLGLCALAAPPPVAGKESDQQPQVVRWRVEFADGTRATLMAPLGETNRVTRQDGSVVAFSPVKDQKTGQVQLQISEVVAEPKKPEVMRLLESVPVDGRAAKSISRIADFTVEIDGVMAPKPERRGDLTGIPLSSRMIRWEMTLSDGKVIRLTAREGEMARLKTPDGQSFGLIPVVRGDRLERIEFRLFGVNKIKGAGESLRLLEAFGLEDGGEYFPTVWGDRLIKVAKAESREATASVEKVAADDPPIVLDNCCVTCGGTRACGCSVSMDCGDCCMPPCCAWVY
jgi:hypothetical protein